MHHKWADKILCFEKFWYRCQLKSLTWDYGEAYHFKGPHNGIGRTVKREVYQDVSASKVLIKDAKHFVEYAHEVTIS